MCLGIVTQLNMSYQNAESTVQCKHDFALSSSLIGTVLHFARHSPIQHTDDTTRILAPTAPSSENRVVKPYVSLTFYKFKIVDDEKVLQ